MGTFLSCLGRSNSPDIAPENSNVGIEQNAFLSRSFIEPLRRIGESRDESRILLCKGESGRTVRRIEVSSFGFLQGIRVTYTDNTSEEIGELNHRRYSELTLNLGETISTATLWVNKLRDGQLRIGRVHLTTSQGRFLEQGALIKRRYQFQYEIPLGSGYLVGVEGCVGNGGGISMLCLVFLKRIESIAMTDLRYDRPLETVGEIGHVRLARAVFTSNGGDPTYDFTSSVQRTSSYSHQSSTSDQFSGNFRVTVRVPTIVSTSAGLQWTTSETNTIERGQSVSQTLQWGLKGQMAQGQVVQCTATAGRAKVRVGYTAKIQATFVGTPDIWTFEDTGTVRSTTYEDHATAKLDILNEGDERIADLFADLQPIRQADGTLAPIGRATATAAGGNLIRDLVILDPAPQDD